MFTASRVVEAASPRGSRILSEKSFFVPASLVRGADDCAEAKQAHRLAEKAAAIRNAFTDEVARPAWDWSWVSFTHGA
jgi:hypothetical protein